MAKVRAARDLAAWIGLTPKPHAGGGRKTPGKITRMGNRTRCRLPCPGALGLITARSKRAREDRLRKMLQHKHKPVKLAELALAAHMARPVRALLKTGKSDGVMPG